MAQVLVPQTHELYDRSQRDMEMINEHHQMQDIFHDESKKDKKHLSLGMLVPDAIQFICAEGAALRWDETGSFYEVIFEQRIIIFGMLMPSTDTCWVSRFQMANSLSSVSTTCDAKETETMTRAQGLSAVCINITPCLLEIDGPR